MTPLESVGYNGLKLPPISYRVKLRSGFWQTYKDAPQDAEIVSHQLMVRSGLIQKSSSGLYNYLPMGLRSLRKVEQIVRDEHNRAGFYELSMSMVTPGEFWKETGRWDKMDDLMLKFQDKGGRDLCLSPTNEEVIVDIFRRTIKSYKQLPLGLYQINTKYRDEIRPRYGLMRCREFIMKDAYSFVLNQKEQDEIYQKFYDLYERIFSRLQLEFMPVEADPGVIASADCKTHEFQVIADSGEDHIIYCETGKYASNRERAQTKRAQMPFLKTNLPLEKIATKDQSTMMSVCDSLNIPLHHGLKALIYTAFTGASEREVVIFLLGDDSLNEIKLKNFLKAHRLTPTPLTTLKKRKIPPGYVGPLHLPDDWSIIFDSAIDLDSSYLIGAMENDYHYKNYLPRRDSSSPLTQTDLRLAQTDDICLQTGQRVSMKKGIEVGHIFQLGDSYSKAMKAFVQDQDGKQIAPLMGCYGIGIGRTVAACIEQSHDEHGIIWPKQIAPYHVYLAVIAKSPEIIKLASSLYHELWQEGVETLLDDRGLSPGFMFKDSDLLGLPLRVTLGERDYKKDGMVEIKVRKTGRTLKVKRDQLCARIKTLLAES